MKKKNLFLLLSSVLFIASCSGESKPSKEETSENSKQTDMKLDKKDVSYALGYNIGDVLNKTDSDLKLDDLIKGIKDAYTKSASPRFNEEEIKKLLMLYNFELSNSMREKLEKAKEENIEKGKAFLDAYKKESGVKELEDGLYYKVIEEGKGPTPGKDDVVEVQYTGKKIDGKEFFSTKTEGHPAEFVVGNVIKGWMIALQHMPVGSTWEIVIPPHLAYGESGVADVIGPDETLVFEIHLLGIKDKKDAEPKQENGSEE